MKAFYGSRFSPNMTRTPEGFLICHNVPISRTGWYEYLGEEIGANDKQGQIVQVYRSPEEVFNPVAIASFEGKTITDEHPPDILNPDNNNVFDKGDVTNVRQGTDENSGFLYADLIIKDNNLISEIEQGKREVSCGYDCIYEDNGDGTYLQRQICGNHVAVVKAGRAGNRVAIQDSKNSNLKGDKIMSGTNVPRNLTSWNKFLTALGLKHFVTDAEPEEVMDAVEELTKENKDGEEELKKVDTPSKDAEPNPELEALKGQVEKLTALVSQLVKAENNEAKPEDAIDEMISELEKGKGEDEDPQQEEESVTIDPEELSDDEDIPEGEVSDPSDRPKNPLPSADSTAMLRMLKTMKPIIANISDPKAKKKAVDSLSAEFKKIKKGSGRNGYANILAAQKKKAVESKKAQDAKEKENLGKEWAKKYNPHYKEVK